MSDDHTEELFTRLRETEAQTREQNVRIGALADRIEQLSGTNSQYIAILREQMDKSDKREQLMMRTIWVLVGAVIALALGIKYAEKVFPMNQVGSKMEIGVGMPIINNMDRGFKA